MRKEILFNNFAKSPIIQCSLLAILGILLILGIYYFASKKYKANVRLMGGVSATIAGVLILIDILIIICSLSSPLPTDTKYYEMEIVPVQEFSLKNNEYKTKDGKIISENKDIILQESEKYSLNVKKTKVKLKHYQLKKEWYDMIGASKNIYYVDITKPATDVKQN